MTEYFDVNPGHVAGYGRLCDDVAGDATGIAGYLNLEASAAEGFDGTLLGTLIAPVVDDYADAAEERVRALSSALYLTGEELTDTAWTYLGSDKPDRFSTVHESLDRGGPYQVELDHPQLVAYPHRPVDGELDTPDLEEMDIDQLIEDNAGGTLEAIETIVSLVTGLIGESYSITGEITEKITGNWMVLYQKADALDHVADAAELAADGLESERSTLDQHWDGGAAMSFGSYLDGLVAGLRYEGPLNRVVAAAYRVAALLIEQAAALVVSLVSDGVDLIRKWATGGVGRAVDAAWGWATGGEPPWEAIWADWQTAKSLFSRASAAADAVQSVPEELRALIDATKSTEAAADYSVSTVLRDMVATGEITEETAGDYQLGYDISSEITPVLDDAAELAAGDPDVPEDGFDAGRHVRRAG